MCDCRSQAAGQPVLSRPSVLMADSRWLKLHGHVQRGLSEPAAIHVAAATALDSLALSMMSRSRQPGRPQKSRATAPDCLLVSAIVALPTRRHNLSSPGKLSATPSRQARAFSVFYHRLFASDAVVEPIADDLQPRNGHLKTLKRQPSEHLRYASTGSELLGQVTRPASSSPHFPCNR